MIGAIAGDVISEDYEHYSIKIKDFPRFLLKSQCTVDEELTMAFAYALVEGVNYADDDQLLTMPFLQ